MKFLFYLIVVASLAVGCAKTQVADTASEQELSFFNMHCREHAEDMYAAEFAPMRYVECMELHKDGIVLIESTDVHLASTH